MTAATGNPKQWPRARTQGRETKWKTTTKRKSIVSAIRNKIKEMNKIKTTM